MTPLHHMSPNAFSPVRFPTLAMHARYAAVAALHAKTRAYPLASNDASAAPASAAPTHVTATARATAGGWVFPARAYSASIVNAAVVRRRVVYIGRFTPRTLSIERLMYAT